MTEDSAAELLGVVRRQQVHTRRVISFGWLIAGLAGAASLASAGMRVLGWEPWVCAVVTGGLMAVIGLSGESLMHRNNRQFGVEPPLARWAMISMVLGLVVGTGVLALLNDERPPSVVPTVAMGVALVLLNAPFLLRRDRDPMPIWWRQASLALGVEVIVSALLFPTSMVGRNVLFGVCALGYGVYGWWRAGRRRVA